MKTTPLPSTHLDYRAKNALLDEYARAVRELQKVINGLTPASLIQVMDTHTQDEDCRSVQTILSHVVKAGFSYVIEIRRSLGEALDFIENKLLPSEADYQKSLDDLLAYNLQLFLDYPELKLEQPDQENKITVRWGQTYDTEQLFEHAIVHILRHRRQIEHFLS